MVERGVRALMGLLIARYFLLCINKGEGSTIPFLLASFTLLLLVCILFRNFPNSQFSLFSPSHSFVLSISI